MFDLPLVLCAATYVIGGFVYGWVIYAMQREKWPFDWRGQWWPFATWGIVWVVFTAFVIWNWFRFPRVMHPETALIDLIVLFSCSFIGITGWQIWGSGRIVVKSEIEIAADTFVDIVRASEKTTDRSVTRAALNTAEQALNGREPESELVDGERIA